MKKPMGKKYLALGLALTMAVPMCAMAGGQEAEANNMPVAVKYMDFEQGFRGDGLDVAVVGDWIQFKEKLDEKGRKPLDANGRATGEYEYTDTVYVSKSWTSDDGEYETVPIPTGEDKQQVPDLKTDTGAFWFRGTANQATTAYDYDVYADDGSVETYGKGNVYWMGETMINQSYPTYATTVDWENGTYTTDETVIVKDNADNIMEFGINNSATEFANPLSESTAEGFAISAWVKNTTKYEEEIKKEYNILGDVNGDGKVDANDALVILKHVANLEILDEIATLFADVNGDTQVNANDALDILKYVAKLITEFTGKTPVVPDNDEEAEIKLLDNTELFHFENREEKADSRLAVLDRVDERSYLYFTANSVVFVKDFTDYTRTCIWTLTEELQGDDLDILNPKNGEAWNYLTYSFDGSDFHMYVNGQERTLEKVAAEGYTTAGADVLALVKDADTNTYLGGLGGGMKDNFTVFAMNTDEDYYLDDVAIYDVNLETDAALSVYTTAAEKMSAELSQSIHLLKTYHFEEATLSANGLNVVSDGKESEEYYPVVAEDADRGTVIKTVTSAQSYHGGTSFLENPFAGKDELTGVSVSYWMKAIGNKRGVVTDGALLSFIDEEKECIHEKVGENYLGINAIASSQLSINMAYSADFVEGQTKPIGGSSLKNIYSFRPYRFGDPAGQTDERLVSLAEPSWDTYKDWLKTLDDKWYFVTVTITNEGIRMYIDGEEVENLYINNAGPRFFDSYWNRKQDAFVNGVEDSGARCLMDFITDETTKVYLGYAFEQGSSESYQKATNCYIDEVSFYDGAMSKTEVKALYQTVSAE